MWQHFYRNDKIYLEEKWQKLQIKLEATQFRAFVLHNLIKSSAGRSPHSKSLATTQREWFNSD